MKSLILEGNCFFYNNSGGLYINSSNVDFTGDTTSFVANTVRANNLALPGTVLFIDSKSSVAFDNSHINFKNNHGHICGGISAKKFQGINGKCQH